MNIHLISKWRKRAPLDPRDIVITVHRNRDAVIPAWNIWRAREETIVRYVLANWRRDVNEEERVENLVSLWERMEFEFCESIMDGSAP